jgi:hypothetical protein
VTVGLFLATFFPVTAETTDDLASRQWRYENMDTLRHIPNHVIGKFMQLAGSLIPRGVQVAVMGSPTEEILDTDPEKRVELFATGRPAQRRKVTGGKRLEENYLYASRRFPLAANNVVPGAPNIAAQDYIFFATAKGQQGQAEGFPAGFQLTDLETNLDIAGQVPQGKDFVLHQIGLSFNARALTGDITQLLDLGALRFDKGGGQFTLFHGPARMWPGGTGVSGFSTNNITEAAHNGVSDIRAVRSLRVPRVLKAGEQFRYVLSIPRNTHANDGANSALVQFVIMTLWLWGGQRDAIIA